MGVLRELTIKIPPTLLKAICARGKARYGTRKKTNVAMNERIRHFGRLHDASVVAPGYVPSYNIIHSRLKPHIPIDAPR